MPDYKISKDRYEALLYIFLGPQDLVFALELLNGALKLNLKLIEFK